MLITNLLSGTLIVVICVLFHVGALVQLSVVIGILDKKIKFRSAIHNDMFLLAIAVLIILFIHTIEAWAWGAVYLIIGEFNNIQEAIYFSVVTSTTLGFGDITLSEDWRLLSSFEAMGGLILFGASTAFLLAIMRNLFER